MTLVSGHTQLTHYILSEDQLTKKGVASYLGIQLQSLGKRVGADGYSLVDILVGYYTTVYNAGLISLVEYELVTIQLREPVVGHVMGEFIQHDTFRANIRFYELLIELYKDSEDIKTLLALQSCVFAYKYRILYCYMLQRYDIDIGPIDSILSLNHTADITSDTVINVGEDGRAIRVRNYIDGKTWDMGLQCFDR